MFSVEYYLKKNITLETGHVRTVTKFNSENVHSTSKSLTEIYMGEETADNLPKSMSDYGSLFRTNLNRCYIVNPVFITRKKSGTHLSLNFILYYKKHAYTTQRF